MTEKDLMIQDLRQIINILKDREQELLKENDKLRADINFLEDKLHKLVSH